MNFLETGKIILDSLCEVMRRIAVRPGYLVIKGGTTSLELARNALGAREATVPGQIINGTPVWKLGGESRWPGITCVVFPGNVGDDEALKKVVGILERAGQQ